VAPQKGTALIFPTATLDGLADERYLHSGEPVGDGVKYIIGTWLMETRRTDAADVRKSIAELYRLEGREPPARAATRTRVDASPAKRAGTKMKRKRR
jgi:hypothetical protein